MKTFFTILITVALTAVGTKFILNQFSGKSGSSAVSNERKVLYYQSAMHPWVKSDKPGRCTICGMELTPVYEGEKGFDDTGDGSTVALTQTQIQVLHVQTDEAKIQPLAHTLQVAGMIDDDARRHRILSAYIDGRIDKLYANHQGIEVVAGEPLALLYSPTLLQAEREYKQLTGDLKKNTALRLQQMGLNEKQIASLDSKPVDALNSEILSPLTGTVVEHDVYEGQYVTMGQKLFAIADFSTMWFMFRAYEQDLPWIQIGQKVTVETPSLPGKSFEGKITFIDPNFDEATRSTKVRVELPNPKVDGRRELLHKLYADGRVHVDTPSVLTIPRSAVIQTGPEAVVYTDQGGGAYNQTPVKIGRRGDKLVEILTGLKAGDKVVTNGNLLIDGQAEMNRSFMSPAATPTPVLLKDGLTDAQQESIRKFTKLADAMAAALSADNLTAFNKASEPAMMTTEELTKSLADIPSFKEKLEALSNARHFHGSDNLKSARVAFHKFITAATAVLEPLRNTKEFPELQIWECSMVDQAIPGAPKKAHWIQLGGRTGNNPFFGAEMLECGKEIKP